MSHLSHWCDKHRIQKKITIMLERLFKRSDWVRDPLVPVFTEVFHNDVIVGLSEI